MIRPILEAPTLPDAADEPVWEIARLFPNQGRWTEDEFLSLSSSSRGVEFTRGRIEFLPMPTILHQRVGAFLFTALLGFVTERRLGEVLFAGTQVRAADGDKYREPDMVVILKDGSSRVTEDYVQRPSLVVEVVSRDDPKRDWVQKRCDYAEAGIPEYWIVDPRDETITVLALEGGAYVEHGRHARGEVAKSRLLSGFEVGVAATFDAGRRHQNQK